MKTPWRCALAGLGLLALLLCAGARAQAPATCPAPADPPTAAQRRAGLREARDHGFLWRITKQGHSSWLYGTLHVGRLEWTFPGPKVDAALKASDTVALEVDLLDPEMQRRMAQGLAAPQDTPFPRVAALPPGLQDRIRRLTDAACLPWELAQRLSPAFEMATLTTLAVRRDGLSAAYGIDMALASRAHDAQVAVVSLESPESQLKLLETTGTAADTLAFVGQALDDLERETARRVLLRTAQVWADGDWAALSDYAAWCDCLNSATDRAEMTRMLDDRNPALADGIAALHESGRRVFAAVGSLHMIGPTGLPAQLVRRGYRVERITYEPPRETRP